MATTCTGPQIPNGGGIVHRPLPSTSGDDEVKVFCGDDEEEVMTDEVKDLVCNEPSHEENIKEELKVEKDILVSTADQAQPETSKSHPGPNVGTKPSDPPNCYTGDAANSAFSAPGNIFTNNITTNIPSGFLPIPFFIGNRLPTSPFYAPGSFMGLDRMPSPHDARNAAALYQQLQASFPLAMPSFGPQIFNNLPFLVGPGGSIFPGSPVNGLQSPVQSPSGQQQFHPSLFKVPNSPSAGAMAIAANSHLYGLAQLKPHGTPGIADFAAAQIAPSTSCASAINSVKKEKPAKKPVPHVKKPLNAFMLYMQEMRPAVMEEVGLKERQSAEINRILGRRWHELSKEDQQKYYDKSREARQEHIKNHPTWSARDNYAVNKKKKKKRDKSLGNLEMKKCRARFGVDQQDKWCKHCRRKKKCLLFTQEMAQQGFPHSNESVSMDEEGSDSLSPEDSPSSSQVSSTTMDLADGSSGPGSLANTLAHLGPPESLSHHHRHHHEMLSSDVLIKSELMQTSSSECSVTSGYSSTLAAAESSRAPDKSSGGSAGSGGGGSFVNGYSSGASDDVRSPLSALVSSTTSVLNLGKSPNCQQPQTHHQHGDEKPVGSPAVRAYSVESLTRDCKLMDSEQTLQQQQSKRNAAKASSPYSNGISSSSSIFASGSEPSPPDSCGSNGPPLLDSTTPMLAPHPGKLCAAFSTVH